MKIHAAHKMTRQLYRYCQDVITVYYKVRNSDGIQFVQYDSILAKMEQV